MVYDFFYHSFKVTAIFNKVAVFYRCRNIENVCNDIFNINKYIAHLLNECLNLKYFYENCGIHNNRRNNLKLHFEIFKRVQSSYSVCLQKLCRINSEIFNQIVFNGHFRNKAYNSVRWACLYSLSPKREKRKYHSVWLQETGNSCKSVFQNTHACEQQE